MPLRYVHPFPQKNANRFDDCLQIFLPATHRHPHALLNPSAIPQHQRKKGKRRAGQGRQGRERDTGVKQR